MLGYKNTLLFSLCKANKMKKGGGVDLMGRLGSCVRVRSRAVGGECGTGRKESISTHRVHVPLSHHQSCMHACVDAAFLRR